MAKVEYTSDARVLAGIRCPAAHACMRERGHFQRPHEVLIAVPGKTRRRRLTIRPHIQTLESFIADVRLLV